MIDHPNVDRRLARMDRFSQASGDTYCWAYLAHIGMFKYDGGDIDSAKDSCRRGETCKAESIENGSCWCHKFVNGKLYIPEMEEVE